jgi:hypothetical protein
MLSENIAPVEDVVLPLNLKELASFSEVEEGKVAVVVDRTDAVVAVDVTADVDAVEGAKLNAITVVEDVLPLDVEEGAIPKENAVVDEDEAEVETETEVVAGAVPKEKIFDVDEGTAPNENPPVENDDEEMENEDVEAKEVEATEEEKDAEVVEVAAVLLGVVSASVVLN